MGVLALDHITRCTALAGVFQAPRSAAIGRFKATSILGVIKDDFLQSQTIYIYAQPISAAFGCHFVLH